MRELVRPALTADQLRLLEHRDLERMGIQLGSRRSGGLSIALRSDATRSAAARRRRVDGVETSEPSARPRSTSESSSATGPRRRRAAPSSAPARARARSPRRFSSQPDHVLCTCARTAPGAEREVQHLERVPVAEQRPGDPVHLMTASFADDDRLVTAMRGFHDRPNGVAGSLIGARSQAGPSARRGTRRRSRAGTKFRTRPRTTPYRRGTAPGVLQRGAARPPELVGVAVDDPVGPVLGRRQTRHARLPGPCRVNSPSSAISGAHPRARTTRGSRSFRPATDGRSRSRSPPPRSSGRRVRFEDVGLVADDERHDERHRTRGINTSPRRSRAGRAARRARTAAQRPCRSRAARERGSSAGAGEASREDPVELGRTVATCRHSPETCTSTITLRASSRRPPPVVDLPRCRVAEGDERETERRQGHLRLVGRDAVLASEVEADWKGPPDPQPGHGSGTRPKTHP